MSGVKRVADVSDWAIRRCHATFRFLYHLQATMDDLAGAAKAGQWEVAVHSMREAALLAVSVRRMPEGCDVLPDVSDGFTGHLGAFDSAGDPALEAVCEAVNRAAQDPGAASVDAALAVLRQYIEQTEAQLGYSDQIPELRSARGTSMLLRLFREGDQFAQARGLPSAIPRDWASAPAGEAA
jgi:hypothetical protein